MNKIKNAIILAAGYGSRMHPLTLSIAKPLINVCGQRIIERLIETLQTKNIQEIIIVLGYQKELFYYLKEKYTGITFVENPDYMMANNISSLYYARQYLGNTIILDGDQIINNPDIIYDQFEHSGYNVIYRHTYSKEWFLDVSDQKITKCYRDGKDFGYQLFSISRWNLNDGLKLKKHLEIIYQNKDKRHLYWDDVVLFEFLSEYELTIYPMNDEDVIEIDSYQELKNYDNRY